MTTVVRRASLHDADRLGVLHSQCWAELYAGVLPPDVLAELSPAVMAQLWQRFVTRGEEYAQYVAEVDGDVVGFVGFGPGRDEGYAEVVEVYFCYVAPGFQRSGIGSELLAAETDATYLWISESNRAAHRFYRRNKFGPDSRRRIGSLFGTDLPEIRMSR
ncbi:GNAT family N-acetyltransferase [Conyzicola nivalis]|uniref:GNAT family N-acetyltransferase n=1 Tax=Conyzicola nivalis TaxID=1477021 RepID=UPI00166710AC|nr:GNAT family N-acetyltransferase [Conyzicola nivalis]